MSTHVYQALEGPKHIRLIALHPASSKDAPLRINFLSSDLGELEARYEAISYTWGQPNLTFALHVDDGSQVFVTENLDRALRYLRRAECDRLLWADAVSINQTDHEEKAVQIPLMVQIFRGARKVLAWLDPGGDTSAEQRGMQMLNRLSRWTESQTWSSTEDFDEVSLFLGLPWFNRLWVIQEVVFSLDIDLICGGTELTFSRLMAGLNVLKRHFPLSKPNREARIGNIYELGRLWNHHSLFDLTIGREPVLIHENEIVSLVENFCSYGCTDARDRIFALCSMATYERHDPPKIDYSLDVCETYQAFAQSCWRWSQSAMWPALLSRQHSPRSANLSSWVPDWRVIPRNQWWKSPPSLFYPFVMRSESTAGILRVKAYTRGLPPDGGLDGLHTITLKTSRTANDNQTSLLSQMLPLYMLLQNPRRCLAKSQLVPDKERIRCSSNILIDMIEILLDQNKYSSSLEKLDIHLATMTTAFEQNDANCDTEPPSLEIRNLIYELDKALEDDALFCFQDPKTQVYSVGVGNHRLETGDEIVILDRDPAKPYWKELIMVLICRRVGHVDHTPLPALPTFQLIGSGYLLNYTSVYLAQGFPGNSKEDQKTRAEQAAWKEFQQDFLQNKAPLWLNLV